MYRVLDKTFTTFEEVIAWAWNEYMIDAFCEPQDEEAKQQACKELALMVSGDL